MRRRLSASRDSWHKNLLECERIECTHLNAALIASKARTTCHRKLLSLRLGERLCEKLKAYLILVSSKNNISVLIADLESWHEARIAVGEKSFDDLARLGEVDARFLILYGELSVFRRVSENVEVRC